MVTADQQRAAADYLSEHYGAVSATDQRGDGAVAVDPEIPPNTPGR